MKICIVDVLKKRNNAVSNLVVGLLRGATESNIDVTCIKYMEERIGGIRTIDPTSIPSDSKILIIPYWISEGIWRINLSDIKAVHPSIKIISYTGTSPFWNGSTPSYVAGNRSLDISDLPQDLSGNLDAIDRFALVQERPGVHLTNQVIVGMGVQKELTTSPKSPVPMVVLDFMKASWDEKSYADAVDCLVKIRSRIPNMKICLLKPTPEAMSRLSGNGSAIVPHEYMPFTDMCKIYTSAWAFICHNESFGYPISENHASGTRVFSSTHSDIPAWHRKWVDPLDGLDPWLKTLQRSDKSARDDMFLEIASTYKMCTPWIKPWGDVVNEIIAGYDE